MADDRSVDLAPGSLSRRCWCRRSLALHKRALACGRHDCCTGSVPADRLPHCRCRPANGTIELLSQYSMDTASTGPVRSSARAGVGCRFHSRVASCLHQKSCGCGVARSSEPGQNCSRRAIFSITCEAPMVSI